VLVHGIAVKPGKPTIIGSVTGKPVIGLPGHPVSAYFIFLLLVRQVICSLNNSSPALFTRRGVLGVNIPSNHGREEYVPVRQGDGSTVLPAPVKSGLITLLSEADGFIRVDRDCEGLMKGDEVQVYLF